MSISNFLQRLRKRIKKNHELLKSRSAGKLRVTKLEERKLLDASFGLDAAGILHLDGFTNNGGGTSLAMDSSAGVMTFELQNDIWDLAGGDGNSAFSLSPDQKLLTLDTTTAAVDRINIKAGDGGDPLASITDGANGLQVAELTIADAGEVTLDSASNNFDTISVQSNSLTLVDSDDVAITSLDTTTDATITADGDIADSAAATVNVGGNSVFAGASITLGDSAGDSVTLGSLKFMSAGDVSISEADDMHLAAGSTGATVDLQAVGNIDGAAGTNITATTISLTANDSAGASSIGSSGQVTVDATTLNTGSGGDQHLSDVDSVDLGSLSSGGTIDLEAGEFISDSNTSVIGTIDLGATGTLGGSGTVSDLILTDGDLSPENSSLNLSNLNLGTAANLNIELNGTAAGSQYGQVNVAGELTLAGTLTIVPGFTAAANDSFTIIKSAEAVSGTFDGLAEGSLLVADGQAFSISYVGGDGNDVVLTAAAHTYSFAIAAESVDEDSGTKTITVNRSGNTSVDSTVDVVLAAGTGTEANDFTTGTTQIEFDAGESSKTFDVAVTSDVIVESDETIDLSFTNFSTGGSAADTNSTAVLTITNDDTATLTLQAVSPAAIDETDTGTTTYDVKAVLSAAVEGGLTVAWATADSAAGTLATAGTDYTAAASSLTFNGTSGEEQSFSVTIASDYTFETDEVFDIALGTITTTNTAIDSAAVTTASTPLTATITNDDTKTLIQLIDGNLHISDRVASGQDDDLTISLGTGGDVVITSASTNLGTGSAAAFSSLSFAVTGDIIITGGDGDDLLTVDYTNGDPLPENLVYHGNGNTTAGDALSVIGSGTQTAVYTPDATTFGDGQVTVDGSTITFTGLEPVDISGMLHATLVLPGGDDVLTVTQGTDFTSGGGNTAIVVAGTSAGVAIESVAFWDNTNLTIDTSTVDGDDAITFAGPTDSADHTNTNLIIKTGVGTDVVSLAGDVVQSGDLMLTTVDVLLTADTELDADNIAVTGDVGDGTGSFTLTLDGATSASVSGTVETQNLTTQTATTVGSVDIAGDLTVAGGQLKSDTGAIDVGGDLTSTESINSATSLSVTGASSIGGNVTSTVGEQSYGGVVTQTAAVVYTAADTDGDSEGVDFGGTVAGGGNSLTVVGGAGFADSVSGVTALVADHIDSESTIAAGTVAVSGTSDIGGNVTSTGNQTYTGAVMLDADVTATGVGLTFGSTVDGDFKLTADGDSGDVKFAGAVGDGTKLSGLVVDGANVDFDGTVGVDDEGLDVDSTGTMSFDAAVFSMNGGTVTLSNTGTLTLAAAADFTTDGAFVQDGGGSVSTAADVVTTGDLISFASAVTQTGSILLDTTNGGTEAAGAVISLNTVAGGNNNLTLNGGSGGAVTSGNVSGINTLTIVDSGSTTFSDTVSASTVAITATTGDVTFNGEVMATTFTAAAAGYGVIFNEGGTITDAVTFNNTGGVAFGDNVSDTINFTNGITSTASTTTIQGTLNTTNSDVTFGTTTLAAQTTINTAAGGGNITAGLVTGSSVPLTLDAGTGDITLTNDDNQFGALNLVAANAEITENADTDIGSITATGEVTLTSAGAINDASASPNTTTDITASKITLNAVTGLGDSAPLQLAAQTISAVTDDGSVNLDNNSASAVTVSKLTTGTGDITFAQSGGGAVSFGIVTTTDGSIDLATTGDVMLTGVVTATDNTITINSADRIVGDGDSAADLVGENLNLTAVNGIGAGQPLETSVQNLTFSNTTGPVQIANDQSLTLGAVSTVGDFELCLSTGDLIISETLSATGGTVRLETAAGSVVESGSGKILTAGLGVNASGSITLGAANNDVDTFAAKSQDGSILFTDFDDFNVDAVTAGDCFGGATGVETFDASGTVTLNADGNLQIDEDVKSVNGKTELNVTSGNLVSNAAIKTVDGVVDINVTTGDALINGAVESTAGDVDIAVSAGSFTSTAAGTVSTQTGDITVDAGTDFTNNAVITSMTGDVDLTGANVVQNASITTAAAGTISVNADNGDITMANLTMSSTDSGTITNTATGSVAISEIFSTFGDITVAAGTDGSGGITDSSAGETANISTSGKATLTAANDIGSTGSDDIDTHVVLLQAASTVEGDVVIHEKDAVNLQSVSTVDGSIDITAGGTITATSVSASGAANAANVTLTATDGDVIATQVSADDNVTIDSLAGNVVATSVTSVEGDIDIDAQTDVTATQVTATKGDVDITADTGNVDVDTITANGTSPAVTVTITATDGSVLDSNDNSAVNIDAANADVVIIAGTNIGAADADVFKGTATNPLEINSAIMNLTAAGVISVHQTTATEVKTLDASAPGTIFLSSDGDIDLSAATPTASQMALLSPNGTITLPASVSAVTGDLRIEGADVAAIGGTIQLNSSRILFKSGQSEEINITADAFDGETTGDLTVNAGSNVVLTDLDCDLTAIDVGSNIAVLNAATPATISQVLPSGAMQNSRILSGSLVLNGTGTFDLTNVDNDTDVLAGTNTGSITFKDIDDVTIDTVEVVTNTATTIDGLTSGNSDVQLDVGTTLTINQQLNAGTGDVRLQSNGEVSQTAAGIITATQLGIRQQAVSGNIQLAAQNDVDILAAENSAAGGSFTFADRDDVTVAEVGESEISDSGFATVTGVTTNSGDLTIDAGVPTTVPDSLSLTQQVNAGSGAVRLISDGNVTQTSDGVITADELGVRQEAASGNIVLDDANEVNQLAAFNAASGGQVTFRNTQDLVVQTVDALNVAAAPTANAVAFTETNGIVATDGDVLLNIEGSLAFHQELNTGTGDARMVTDGNINQTVDGAITARHLGIRQEGIAGIIDLGAAPNDVDVLGTHNAAEGAVTTFFDADDLTIDEISQQQISNLAFTATAGVNTNAGDINVTSADNLTVNRTIDAAHDTLTSSIDESITLVSRNGDFTLADNTVITSDENPAPGVFDDVTGDSISIIAGSAGSNGIVDLGADVEIRTDGGVAKQLAPRPTAFSAAPTTGAENAFVTLTDAENMRSSLNFVDGRFLGELELVFGVAGEENLEVVIDWGVVSQSSLTASGPAGNATANASGDLEFAQTDADKSIFYLDVGGQTYVIPHLYHPADMVATANDRNGRQNNPNIVGVRFSVAQHESINIWGSNATDPTGVTDTLPPVFTGTASTVVDANGKPVATAGQLALLSSTDTNGLNRFGQEATNQSLPLAANRFVTSTGRPEGLAEWEFLAGPSPAIPPVAKLEPEPFIAPRVEVPEIPPAVSEVPGDLDLGAGVSADSGGGTEVYLQIRRHFELDVPAEIVIQRITNNEFISNRNSFEQFVEDNAELQDGDGYEVWLITETGGQTVARPIVEFEITGGRPGPATEELPDRFEPYELKELDFEQPEPEEGEGPDEENEDDPKPMETSAIERPTTDVPAVAVQADQDGVTRMEAGDEAAGADAILPAIGLTAAARWKRRQQARSTPHSRAARLARRMAPASIEATNIPAQQISQN